MGDAEGRGGQVLEARVGITARVQVSELTAKNHPLGLPRTPTAYPGLACLPSKMNRNFAHAAPVGSWPTVTKFPGAECCAELLLAMQQASTVVGVTTEQ
jgi:hypothetical protein